MIVGPETLEYCCAELESDTLATDGAEDTPVGRARVEAPVPIDSDVGCNTVDP